MAVISGESYQVGDRLPPVGLKGGNERVQFTLVEVRDRSVVLEFQGPPSRRFEKEMPKPADQTNLKQKPRSAD
jgi:hypothetical protein